MAEITSSSVWARDAGEDLTAELVAGGLVEEIAEAAHRNRVMITITVTPYDDETGADE